MHTVRLRYKTDCATRLEHQSEMVKEQRDEQTEAAETSRPGTDEKNSLTHQSWETVAPFKLSSRARMVARAAVCRNDITSHNTLGNPPLRRRWYSQMVPSLNETPLRLYVWIGLRKNLI